MKKIIGLMLVLVMVCGLMVGCEETSDTTSEESAYTEQIKQQSLDIVGLPDVSNFFEMAQLKEIYEMRDNPKLICYWYTKNEYSGKWIYQGTCIGYGIPYGASITNPEQTNRSYSQGGFEILPQAEPNGLYTNTVTSSATWILTTDKDGNIKPTYVESEITVVQVKMDARLCEDWSIHSDY